MKILLLTQFFSQTRGGGEYVFSMIAEQLAGSGHQVWVVTNRIRGELYGGQGQQQGQGHGQEQPHENIHMVFVPPTLDHAGGLPPGMLDNARYAINAISRGRGIVKKNGIDIIHSNNFAPALAGSVLSSITGVPHITTIHDVFSLCGKCYWKKWGAQSGVSRTGVMLAPLFERLVTRVGHSCIHTVSEASRDDLIKSGAKKPVYVIHNAIQDEGDGDGGDGGGGGKPGPATAGRSEFVCVGRLVFYKNLEVVIRAVDIVRRTEPGIRLTIIGDGPHRNQLQELARSLGLGPEVDFAGYVPHDKKMAAISRSCALLFPSLCEGFGLVMLEAFSRDRPVLASDVRPMSDIIRDGEAGFVLDPHDSKEWAERMLLCMQSPGQVDRMGWAGNRLLHKSFSRRAMLDGLLGMYAEQIR